MKKGGILKIKFLGWLKRIFHRNRFYRTQQPLTYWESLHYYGDKLGKRMWEEQNAKDES